MSILAVLQARYSSTRLPGKVLKPILGRPMLALQIERILQSRRVHDLILATSDQPDDDPVAALARQMGVGCYRGSLHDVLDRFYQAAAPRQPAHVVRLTGDCPLLDSGVLDAVIDRHLACDADYTSNVLEYTFPDGLDVEVFRFYALAEAWREATLPSQREHVTPFINQQPDRYRVVHYRSEQDWSSMRWTVDEPEDFELVRRVYESLYPVNRQFSLMDVRALLQANPDWLRLNQHFIRNEGLLKSQALDRA